MKKIFYTMEDQMMKKIKQILSVLLVTVMLLSVAPLGQLTGFDFMSRASAANEKTVSVQFIVDSKGKYMETFEITFSTIAREANSATLKITWKNTIFANHYDAWRYDAEVKCGSVGTGKKIVVPKDTWKKTSSVARSKSANTTLKIPVSTTNETTVNLVCYQYQCKADGTIRYTEKEKPGTVKYTIPKYNAPAKSYTLSYNANGGTGAPASQSGAEKYTISSTKPSRSGYTFLGWAKANSATSATYSSGSSITLTGNTTLYAVWKKNDTTNPYNLGDESYSFKNFTKCEQGNSCNNYGHCYGMSVTSEAYYHGVLSKSTVGKKDSDSVYSFSSNSSVKKPICYYQRRQSSSTIVAGGRRYKNQKTNAASDWSEAVNYVKSGNYNNKGKLIISVKYGKFGHAVDFLYYKEVNGQQRIYVYDNNIPSIETYFYKGTDGKIYQAPNKTFPYSDCIAVRSFDECIAHAGDYDGTHVIYAEEGTISVEGAVPTPMDCGTESAYVLFEIPENYCEVIITPLTDNAEFSYMDETYSFGEINEDTYGTFTLASDLDGATDSTQKLFIENAELIKDTSINYKATTKLNVNFSNPAKVEFSSSNPDIVSVDGSGNIKGIKTGEATITCTVTDSLGNVSQDACTVTVSYAWWQWIIRIVLLGFLWY